MLVRCPECRIEFRLLGEMPRRRVIRYLCQGCRGIVRLDLELDEVTSSSSSGSYRSIDRSKTVLVADGSEPVLKIAGDLLRRAGYRVLLATDGPMALRKARESHPDLVILDLQTPGLNGFEVLREIRKDSRLAGTPVVVMSRVYRANVLRTLHRERAQGYLYKPGMKDTLVFRTQQLLTHR